MMLDLDDHKAVVLGGSCGIGLATAALLQERGSKVTIGARDEQRLAEAAESLARGATTIPVDATDTASLRHLYEQVGPFDDLVVTVTRRGGAGPVSGLADQDLGDAFAGKPAAHLRAIALALPTLSPTGSITLVSAASALASLPGTSVLAAVNGAIEAAVAPLARELAPRRVNAVSPGVIETGWWDVLPAEDRQAVFARFAEQTPVGRNGTPDDVAHAIVSLIENDYTTGVVLPCDGGLRMT
jgi:NAD(P)-dependent dehydrogenase (short-subunit alcohol dehydrogenase family)